MCKHIKCFNFLLNMGKDIVAYTRTAYLYAPLLQPGEYWVGVGKEIS